MYSTCTLVHQCNERVNSGKYPVHARHHYIIINAFALAIYYSSILLCTGISELCSIGAAGQPSFKACILVRLQQNLSFTTPMFYDHDLPFTTTFSGTDDLQLKCTYNKRPPAKRDKLPLLASQIKIYTCYERPFQLNTAEMREINVHFFVINKRECDHVR